MSRRTRPAADRQGGDVRRAAGFTIVEAVVTVAVLAILTALAGPSLSGMVASQQIKNAGFDLSSTLQLARSEALTRNVAITVAPTGGSWAQGWTVTDAGGSVLRRQSGYARVTVTGPASIIFNGDGRPDSTATPFALAAADVSEDSTRCIRVRLNGRPAIAKGACS